jgi:prepilin-type N-terminal cleavage/methylation domain-containing protein
MMSMKSNERRAFTLVELLVVMAIIGVLAGFIFPAMRKAKERAKMTQCANNLIQLSRAVDLFRAEHDDDPRYEDGFPHWLSNLYPSYIDSWETYICPADYCTEGPSSKYSEHPGADGSRPWWDPEDVKFHAADDTKYCTYSNLKDYPRNSELSRESSSGVKPIDYCSYLYLFCPASCPLSGHQGYSWRRAMFREMNKETGSGGRTVRGRVPLVSCFWHQKREAGTSRYGRRQKGVINVAAGEKNAYYTGATGERWWK